MKEILGVIAVMLGLFGYAFYIRGIVQGKVKPHAFTWLIWTLLTGIAFVAQIAGNGGPGAWVTGVTALASLAFTIVGFGESSRAYISKNDWVFFLCALLTIPVWYFTGNPLWSVIMITVIDFVAFIPTIRKAYYHPRTENVWTSTSAGIKFAIALAALSSFTWTTALYPTYAVVANVAFAIMLTIRKEYKK